MTLRWMHLAVLIVAFAICMGAQDLPRQEKPATNTPSNSAQPAPDNGNANPNVKPDPQDANHSNSAIAKSNDLEKSDSAMQKSAPATGDDANQAQNKLAAQTSPKHEVRTSTWVLFWIGVAVIVSAILLAARRPRRRVVADRRRMVDQRGEDTHRAA